MSVTNAGAAVQRLTCNDVSVLTDGKAQYSALLNPEGGIIDDIIVYRLTPERFLLVVNGANRATDRDWIVDGVEGRAEVADRTDELALLALQGPLAAEILAAQTDLEIDKMTAFQAAEGRVAGRAALVARTGYTGEDGFEVRVQAGDAEAVWRTLLDAGGPRGLAPIGLAARDTLRLEAGMLLHGNDIWEETTPLEAGLNFIVKLDRDDFIGKEALVGQKRDGLRRRLCGLEMVEPGIARRGHPVLVAGEVQGEVTSGSFAPFLKKSIARAFLPPEHVEPGTELQVEIRNRRPRACVVKTPFYRRARR